MAASTTDLVKWLMRPEVYPHRPESVEVKETHISWVFLTGAFAYKLKKPVHFDFLDFSTLESRRQACEDEVRLNRRLASQVYLGTVPVFQGAGGEDADQPANAGPFSWEPGPATSPSEPVDWLVKMVQLPADQTLEAAIRADRVEADALDELAETLIRFYQQAPRSRLDPAGYRDGFLTHVRGNRDELLVDADGATAAVVKKLHTAQLAMLALDVDTFDARVTSAQIVDGHGDLRPEHIYLTRPPLVMDCIEFSQQFRQLDVADELAFLAMECDRLQASWVGQGLLDRCRRAMSETPSASLVAFYKVYRACVRAKVLQLRARQLEGEQADVARRAVRTYLELAAGYQHDLPGPILLVVGGLMGSGKSTLARRIAETLGIDVLSTDEIRHARFGASPAPAAFAGGHYSDDKRACVYQEMFTRAEQALDQGMSVVLDGSFVSQEACQRAAELGRRAERSIKLRCVCPDEVARQRIVARRQQDSTNDRVLSEARPELYDLQKRSLESVKSADWVPVDTTLGLDEQEQFVLAGLRSAKDG